MAGRVLLFEGEPSNGPLFSLPNEARQVIWPRHLASFTATVRLLTGVCWGASWVPVEVIAQFGRVKNLTQDCELIKKALSESNVVTIDHKRDMMRPKDQNARTVTQHVATPTSVQAGLDAGCGLSPTSR